MTEVFGNVIVVGSQARLNAVLYVEGPGRKNFAGWIERTREVRGAEGEEFPLVEPWRHEGYEGGEAS